MTYEEGIKEIPKQFGYQAKIINADKIKPYKKVIVLGMGGSRLGADILKMVRPDLEINIHSSFGLPPVSPEVLSESIIIANSYSGDTQETVSGAKEAIKNGYNLIIVTGGGELEEIAEDAEVPYIIFPHSELPARLMVGLDIVCLATVLGLDIKNFQKLDTLNLSGLKDQAQEIVATIGHKIPVIYTPDRFSALGYCWKIVLNETAKIPAFSNRFPEAFHNEIESYGSEISKQLVCLIINDPDEVDHRIDTFKNILNKNNVSNLKIELSGNDIAEQVVSSLILSHLVALELAKNKGLDPSGTPLIVEFKNS